MLHGGLDQHPTASKAQPSQQSTTMIGSGVAEQLDKIIATTTRDVRCQYGHRRRRTTHAAPYGWAWPWAQYSHHRLRFPSYAKLSRSAGIRTESNEQVLSELNMVRRAVGSLALPTLTTLDDSSTSIRQTRTRSPRPRLDTGSCRTLSLALIRTILTSSHPIPVPSVSAWFCGVYECGQA